MTLGENIKKRREELKLSQKSMAEQLGISRQTVSKWETGRLKPTAGNLIQLADLLEINLSELVDPYQDHMERPAFEKENNQKKPNPILQANLIKIAIIAQAAFIFSCTSVIYQLQRPAYPNKDLYLGALIFSLVLLVLCSIWMAANHRYEPDKKQRRKNINIELGYCCIQLLAGLLTIQFGMGLVGAALMIVIVGVYILYINPRFMARKLTR